MTTPPRIIDGEAAMTAEGMRLAALLPARAVVFLIGNLGAGKTTLAKGIVQGLGAAEADQVSSPTFTLIHEYGDPVCVYHIDLYRIEDPRQLCTLGLDEICDRDAIVLIEWPERFRACLPPPDVTVSIEHVTGDGGEDLRRLSIEFHSAGLRQ